MEACARVVVWVFNEWVQGLDHTADRDIQQPLTTLPHSAALTASVQLFSAFPQITAIPTIIRACNHLCRSNMCKSSASTLQPSPTSAVSAMNALYIDITLQEAYFWAGIIVSTCNLMRKEDRYVWWFVMKRLLLYNPPSESQ